MNQMQEQGHALPPSGWLTSSRSTSGVGRQPRTTKWLSLPAFLSFGERLPKQSRKNRMSVPCPKTLSRNCDCLTHYEDARDSFEGKNTTGLGGQDREPGDDVHEGQAAPRLWEAEERPQVEALGVTSLRGSEVWACRILDVPGRASRPQRQYSPNS